eukprot:s722_g15.t1
MPCRGAEQRIARAKHVNLVVKRLVKRLNNEPELNRMHSTNRLYPLGSLKQRRLRALFGGWTSKFIGKGRIFTGALAKQVCTELRSRFGMDAYVPKDEAVRLRSLLQVARKRKLEPLKVKAMAINPDTDLAATADEDGQGSESAAKESCQRSAGTVDGLDEEIAKNLDPEFITAKRDVNGEMSDSGGEDDSEPCYFKQVIKFICSLIHMVEFCQLPTKELPKAAVDKLEGKLIKKGKDEEEEKPKSKKAPKAKVVKEKKEGRSKVSKSKDTSKKKSDSKEDAKPKKAHTDTAYGVAKKAYERVKGWKPKMEADWLESQERADILKGMSENERKRRRFK